MSTIHWNVLLRFIHLNVYYNLYRYLIPMRRYLIYVQYWTKPYRLQVTKRFRYDQKTNNIPNICYKHNDTHFYSKVTFFWLNSLLSKGYKAPLDPDCLGELPDDERSLKYYKEFEKIYHDKNVSINRALQD